MEYCTVCELLCHNYRVLPVILAYLVTLEIMEKMYVCKKKNGHQIHDCFSCSTVVCWSYLQNDWCVYVFCFQGPRGETGRIGPPGDPGVIVSVKYIIMYESSVNAISLLFCVLLSRDHQALPDHQHQLAQKVIRSAEWSAWLYLWWCNDYVMGNACREWKGRLEHRDRQEYQESGWAITCIIIQI